MKRLWIFVFLLASFISMGAPVAEFSASPLTACTGTVVTFTSNSTGSIVSWSWNFGAGASPATSASSGPVAVTYSTAGLKNISLTVTAADGTSSITKTDYINVSSSAPVVSGTISGSTAVCAFAQNVSYSISAISNAASYLWTSPSGSTIASGQGSNSVTVNFGASSGNICVTASNGCGTSSSNCKNITVGTDQVKIMTYNLLKYPDLGNLTVDTGNRNPYFRTTLAATDPDILAVQELNSLSGMTIFLNNVMNANGNQYAAGTFIDGFDSDNGIFYKTSKFSFVSNTRIRTDLRDHNEFKLVHLLSGDTLRIYSVHLKASAGAAEEAQRALEVDSLRKITNALPAGSKFIVLGDFNIYKSSESAYQKLIAINAANEGHVIDPFPLTGTWNNIAYAPYHTQSTRTRAFNGGSTGGLNDRFDMMLYSKSIQQGTSISYVTNTMKAFGNDGNHYGDSINKAPNTAVSTAVANALHYSADHLPVIATFQFQNATCPYADLGISAIVSPTDPTCANETQSLTVAVKNYGSNSVSFSSNNLQVNLAVTLPNNSVRTFSKIVNSGVISALGTMNVTFDSTLNMSPAGSYIFTSSTVFTGDTVSSNNSITATATVYVNAGKTITASGSLSFCSGGSVNLKADTSSSITYQWQKNGVNITGATSSSLNVNETGAFRCVQQKTNNVTVINPSKTFFNNNSFSIPDNSCTGTTSTISVTGYTGAVSTAGISVKINISHTYVGDLVIYLEAPNGDKIGLSNRTGNSSNSGDNFTNTIFSDAGTTIVPTTGAPYTGTYKPWNATFTSCSVTMNRNTFGSLAGGALNPNGSWKLIVYDRNSTDVGSISNWSITFPSYSAPYTLVCDPVISTAVNVTVNPLPTLSISPANPSICNSASVNLTASGAATYVWSPSTGLNTTSGSTVTASVSSATTYTVTGTDNNGCVNTTTKQVNINTPPLVTLSTPSSACINSAAITLTGGSPAGGTYSGPGVSGNTFSPASAGAGTHTITYAYTDANGCSNAATSNITVNPLPSTAVSPPGPLSLCQGGSIVLSATPGFSYQWSTGQTTSSLSVSAAGNYSVRVTDAIGCSATSSNVSVTVSAFQMSGTVFNETVGTPSGNTAISNFQNNGGFSATGLLYYGTADVRTSTASSGYSGASGGGNFFLSSTAGTYFGISRINTQGLSNLQLSFGVFKSTTAANGSDLQILVSTDSITFTPLSFSLLPTGTGTAVWAQRTITSGIPSAPTVFLRFTNLNTGGNSNQYRIDDLNLRYTITSPSISASASTTFCQGGSVNLLSTPALSYMWNTGETSRSISATTSGIRYCNVTGENGCVATSNSLNVSVNPSLYSVSGSGSYCSGGTGLPIQLTGSETGVNYQLRLNGINAGSPITGTGNAISFGNQTAAGTYSVLATNPSLSCTAAMNSTAVINVNSLPTPFTVTGGGLVCTNGNGVSIGLNGSQTTVSYQLFVNSSTPIGSSIQGTGSALSFGNFSAAGTYSVIATNSNGCTSAMTGNAVVTLASPPSLFNITGGGSFCNGATGVPVGLSGSEIGITYQLKSGSAVISSLNGNGSALNFGNINSGGNYAVFALNPVTGCGSIMNGSASVQVLARPFVYNVTGGGDYCSVPGTGVAIGLSHSDDSVIYQLYHNGSSINAALTGTEGPLSFGLNTFAGLYTVVSTGANGCTSSMNGSALVIIDQASNWYLDNDGDGYGNVAVALLACEQPVGYVSDSTDCNDGSNIVYPSASEICGNGIDENCNGQTDENCNSVIHIKVYLQGFFTNGRMNAIIAPGITDTIQVSLAHATHKNILFTETTTVDTFGLAEVSFTSASTGTPYYFVINHRQSLQSWSANPIVFNNGLTVDLTTSNAIYGNNSVDLGNGRYGIITGDIDRDGNVSWSDLSLFEINSLSFPTGYCLFDLNGDGIGEATDYDMLENNIGAFEQHP